MRKIVIVLASILFFVGVLYCVKPNPIPKDGNGNRVNVVFDNDGNPIEVSNGKLKTENYQGGTWNMVVSGVITSTESLISRDEVETSTGELVAVDVGLQTQVTNVRNSTGTLRNETIVSTASICSTLNTAVSNIASVRTSTGVLRNEVIESTSTICSTLNTAVADIIIVKNSTGTLRDEIIDSTTSICTTLNTAVSDISAVRISTGVLRNEVITSTASICLTLNDATDDIVTLYLSTGTLDTNKLNKSGGVMTGQVQLKGYSTADLQGVVTPIGVGVPVYCTDDTLLYISTGTEIGCWAKVKDGTAP